jgi:inner membrane protein
MYGYSITDRTGQMLLFAHTGITLGTAKVMARAAGWREKGLPAQLDYRLVLIGSMLPDLIDKPLGGVILPLGNGRIYSHTLLFLLAVLVVGVVFWFWKRKTWGLVLAGGTALHHTLDFMWQDPQTFLWPLYGWGFPTGDAGDWLGMWLTNLVNPQVLIPEIIGLLILAVFVLELRRGANR